jgi:hypothetical protein
MRPAGFESVVVVEEVKTGIKLFRGVAKRNAWTGVAKLEIASGRRGEKIGGGSGFRVSS